MSIQTVLTLATYPGNCYGYVIGVETTADGDGDINADEHSKVGWQKLPTAFIAPMVTHWTVY